MKSIPEIDHVFVINGFNGVRVRLSPAYLLKPWARAHAQPEAGCWRSCGPKFLQCPGRRRCIAFSPPALPGSTGGPPMQFVIRTHRRFRDARRRRAEDADRRRARADCSCSPTAISNSTRRNIEFKVDADKANRLGVNMQDIGTALATMLGGNYVNPFNLYGRSYEVIPQAPRDFRLTPDWLTRYQVRTTNGDLVPLSTVASVTETVQPNALTSFQQLNSATLSGVPFPGRTLGEGARFPEGRRRRRSSRRATPTISRATAANSCRKAMRWSMTFVFALIVIFLVLAAQFESFRDPLIILIALPTSMFGALLPLNIGGVLGARQHQYLFADRARDADRPDLQARHPDGRFRQPPAGGRKACSRREAIEQAAAVRLRPILMTTAAMVVGMVPLIIAAGAGARSRFSIGLTIFFGMAIGTVFTLFVTPAVYTFLARDHAKARAAGQGAGHVGAETGEAAATV